MPDQNDLLKAIRVIVREEVQEELQPVKNNVFVLKEDMHEVKQNIKIIKGRLEVVEKKVEDMPERMLELIAEPLVKED